MKYVLTVFTATLCFVCFSTFALAESIRKGKVAQVMPAGKCIFLQVKENSGKKVWVATATTEVGINDTIEYIPASPMKNFKSKDLNREFKEVFFVNGIKVVWRTAKPVATGAIQRELNQSKSVINNDPIPNNLIDEENLYIVQHAIRYSGAYDSTGIRSVAISNDDKYLITSQLDSEIESWKKPTISVFRLDTYDKEIDIETNEIALNLAFSSDSSLLATNIRNKLYIYNTSNWEVLIQIENEENINSIDFSQDGSYLAVGDGEFLKIYYVGNWKQVAQIRQKSDIVKFSADSSYIAIADGEKLFVYRLENMENILKIDNKYSNHGVKAISFSLDGKYLLVGGDSEPINIFEVGSWKLVYSINNETDIRSVGFTKDSKLFYIDSWGKPIKLFVAGDWQYLQHIEKYGILSFDGNRILLKQERDNQNLHNDEWLIVLDSSEHGVFSLKKDLLKLNQIQLANDLVSQSIMINENYQKDMKVIQIELQNSLVQLSSTQKDEFETDAEYRARIAIRESKSTEFNNKFQNKRVSLRRDRFSNRVQLVRQYDEKLNHIFIANRKPVTNLKAYTGNYSPEAEIFPITISTEGRRSNNPEQAVTWRGTVKVPRGQAKAFKEGVDKYKISGELQSTRTGDKILVNITLTSPEGSDSYKLAWKDLPKSVGKPKIEKKAETEVAEPAEQTETEEAKPASKL